MFVPANDAAPQHLVLARHRRHGQRRSAPTHRACTSYVIDAEAEPAAPGGWPKGGVTRLELPNRHLEYALTWYGLAGALVAVFIAFAATRWRQTRPK